MAVLSFELLVVGFAFYLLGRMSSYPKVIEYVVVMALSSSMPQCYLFVSGEIPAA